jgi:hypothetical protein
MQAYEGVLDVHSDVELVIGGSSPSRVRNLYIKQCTGGA